MRAPRSGHAFLLAAVVALAAASGCGTQRGDPSSKRAGTPSPVPLSALGKSTALGGEVVARVGETSIDAATVLAVARAQHVSAEAAARLLIDEALLTEAARRAGAESTPTVKQGTTAALAGGVVRKFRQEALARGEISDAELAAVLAAGEEWMELDRPETRQAVHALVSKDVPDGEAVAKRLRDAVATAPTVEAFLQSARDFGAANGLSDGKLVVETLPAPFTEDGRVVKHEGGNFTLEFTRAAFAITRVGDTSDVVWNPLFGWHVIRLVAIDPPRHVPRPQLVEALQGQVIRARVGSTFQDLVARLMAEAHPQLPGDDATLMAPQFGSPLLPAPAPAPPSATP